MRHTLPTLVAAILAIAGPDHEGQASPLVASAESSPDEQAPRFGAEAQVVTVDVVVLDESGDPVEDLTPDDFIITDEGRTRPISRFEAVTLAESPETEVPETTLISTNTSAHDPSARTFAIVFDDVHMDRTTAQRAKRAVAEFVNVLRPGDRVSLVPTSGGAWWHAWVPEGCHDLLSSLRRLRGLRPRDSSVERMSDYEALRIHLHRDPEVLAQVTRRFVEYRVIFEGMDTTKEGPLSGVPQRVRHELFRDPPHPYISGRAAEIYQAALSRKQATYDSLRRVAEALEATRGRKSVLLVSEGFVQEPGLREHRDAVEAAQRANAAFHFVDARGLTGIPPTADGEVGDAIELPFMSAQLDEALLESEGAVSLAGDTGGRVVKNANDLARGLRRLERESRAYYLLGFEPTNVEANGSFRRLKVEVHRPGVEILARRGYYAPFPERETPHDEVTLDPRLRAALDSPMDADAIPLRMASYVLGPADGKATTLFVADVDPRALALEEKDELFEGVLEILIVVSNRDTGEQVSRRHEVSLRFPRPVFEQIQKTRLPVMVDVPLARGPHQARLVVRDLRSGVIGTVRHALEVPMPGAFRISTPILTDVVDSGYGSPHRPRPLARRTFVADRSITLLYQVHGAQAPPEGLPRVVAGFRVESPNGTVVAAGADVRLTPGPEGGLSQMAAISLAEAPAGLYSVVVTARDEVAGKTVETRTPFRIAPRPGTAAVEETAPEPGRDDALKRLRAYIIDTPQRTAPPVPVAPVGQTRSERTETDPGLAALLDRAGTYVRQFEERFSGIVAEETYTQRVEAHGSELGFQPRQRQVTRADMVFVRLGGTVPWACFRDVFEVNGHEVRDREARLERLFLQEHPSGAERIREILEASAAHNIGPTVRTVNLPTLPLVFLHPNNQSRFRFESSGRRQIAGVEGVELRLVEVGRPTIVRQEGRLNLPAEGRVWIDPVLGTVLRTEVRFEFVIPDGCSEASLSVEYRPVPELAMWVPVEMNERYEDVAGRRPYFGPTTVANARYSNFRRFSVTLDTEAHLPRE